MAFPAATSTEARLWWENRDLSRRIGEVLTLHFAHSPETAAIMDDPKLVGKCRVCRVTHPCPTVEALTR